MPHPNQSRFKFVAAAVAIAIAGGGILAEEHNQPNSQPNPYRPVEDWAKLPEGRVWGQVPTADVDSHGNIWVLERCGGTSCVGRSEDPVLEYDQSSKLLKSFGGGMFVYPHGIFIDKEDNVWTTDGLGKDGKGQQVIKFSPEGKVLMRLGTAGVAGEGPDTFNKPSDVAIAANGDIFVADGHGGDDSNARIVKFSKGGKFIKTWGQKGTAPGEFNAPHSLAFDSRGRLFVADRGNNRIQIFDQEGNFLDQWKQFGRPTGIFIDKYDTLYVADSDSDSLRNPGWARGIRFGSAKDGSVKAFIPEPKPGVGGEGVAADAMGNIYGAETTQRKLQKYVKQ